MAAGARRDVLWQLSGSLAVQDVTLPSASLNAALSKKISRQPMQRTLEHIAGQASLAPVAKTKAPEPVQLYDKRTIPSLPDSGKAFHLPLLPLVQNSSATERSDKETAAGER